MDLVDCGIVGYWLRGFDLVFVGFGYDDVPVGV